MTRGHHFRFKGDVRGKVLSAQRVVGASNTMPGVAVDADMKVAFKQSH